MVGEGGGDVGCSYSNTKDLDDVYKLSGRMNFRCDESKMKRQHAGYAGRRVVTR